MSPSPDTTDVELRNAVQSYDAAIYSQIAEHGFDDVTAAQCALLEYLPQSGASMVQIAAARGVSKQAIQGQIKSLLAHGYVTAKSDPSDARIKRITHTQRGQDVVASLNQAKIGIHNQIEAKLGPERLKNFRNMLGQVVAATQVSS